MIGKDPAVEPKLLKIIINTQVSDEVTKAVSKKASEK